jgi:hypothetical protein
MAKKKPARKSRKAAAGRRPARQNPRKGARVVARKNARSTKRARTAAHAQVDQAPALGRPKVTGEEDLDLLFKEDFHARQIFKFLSVATVKELERFSPGEILRRVSTPIKETVERVRRSLAERNRCLAGDEAFALEHKEHSASLSGNAHR